MLVAAMVGLDVRSTMDLDAIVKEFDVNVKDAKSIINSIISVPLDDGVVFHVKQISEIMDGAEYPGIRVSMETVFDGVVTPLKIDISTGDVITPHEIRYSFRSVIHVCGIFMIYISFISSMERVFQCLYCMMRLWRLQIKEGLSYRWKMRVLFLMR